MSQVSEYKNPVVPGFAPDPSVVLVDDTFYLVNSSFHVFPGLPIYASKDLRSWSQIGNAIHRPEQLSLDNASSAAVPIGPGVILVATQGLFAPTIRYHNRTFYIICTNSSVEFPNLIMKNFYVTTKDIWSGEWSDPIWFDFQGIDPSLFFDDDGRAYIQGSWREGDLMNTKCSIRQFEVDIATGEPLSETKLLWDGFAEKDDAEGPHLYRKDGYYYLIAAEAGTFEHHMMTAARSRDIWGPYESCEKNPVLTAFGTKEYIQNTGHGDLFQGRNGDWWAVCLGVRNGDGRYPLGRETFLTSVSWPKNGWPEINHPRMSFKRENVTSSPPDIEPSEPTSRLLVDLIHIRTPRSENYIFSPAASEITLIPQKTTLSTPTGTATFIGKRQRLLDCTATATLKIPENRTAKPHHTIAGLTLYKDDIRHSEIFYDSGTSEVYFASVQKLKGDDSKVERKALEFGHDSTITFQIRAEPTEYQFCFRVGFQGEWETLGSIDSLSMTACDFTGTIFGIFASTEETSSIPVIFDDFQVSE